MTVLTSAPPILLLIAQNPHFFPSCAPLAIIGSSLGLVDAVINKGVPKDLLQQDYTRTIPSQKWTLSMKPIKLVVKDEELILAPQWRYPASLDARCHSELPSSVARSRQPGALAGTGRQGVRRG